MRLLVDLLLIAATVLLFSYAFLGDAEYYFGSFPRRKLVWKNVPLFITWITRPLTVRTSPWGLRNKSKIMLGIVVIILLVTAVMYLAGNKFPPTLMLFPLALLPRLYYRSSKEDLREIDIILPVIIQNMRSLITYGGDMSVSEALNLALVGEEGPAFVRLREELLRMATGHSLKNALQRVAEHYNRPSFRRFANILSEHELAVSELEGPLRSLYVQMRQESDVALHKLIARRGQILLVVGGVSLLPAFLVMLLLPAISEFVGGV